MLRNIGSELGRLTQSLPSHQPLAQFRRVLVPSARGYATGDKNLEGDHEGQPQFTEVPIPDKEPISPPAPQEFPKIDHSRPLPPPAYARSRLGNVQGAEDIEDQTFNQPAASLFEEDPKSPDDIRAMNHELNKAPKAKSDQRPENQFDHRFDSAKLDDDQARQDQVTRSAQAQRDQTYGESPTTR